MGSLWCAEKALPNLYKGPVKAQINYSVFLEGKANGRYANPADHKDDVTDIMKPVKFTI